MKAILTACFVFLCLLWAPFAQAEDVFLKPLHDNTILRDKPDVSNSKIIEAAQADWFLHASGKHTADDGSQWYEVYQINEQGMREPSDFWYAYRMYNLPGEEVFVNAKDVEIIPDPRMLESQGKTKAVAVCKPSLVSGNIVAIHRYTDTTGDNMIVLVETDITVGYSKKFDAETQTKELFAYRFIPKEDNDAQQVWRVMDSVRDCDLDGMTAEFITDAFRMTDVNNNGLAEIWLPYILQCAGDPGPMPMKIIMYEGEKKYAVRGETRSWVGGDEYAGGECTLDQAFTDGPAELRKFAVQLWEEYKMR